MSESETTAVAEVNDAVHKHHSDESLAMKTFSGRHTLRWWPAAAIIALMALIKWIPSLLDSPPLPVMMLGFMGPAVVGLLLIVWWLFASRASIAEKLVGFVSLIVIAAATISILHFSMKGMGIFIFQFPVGLAAFALPLILLARYPGVRLGTALVCALVGFGFWDLLRMHGLTGQFAPELGWRWTPSAEDDYLKSLADTTGSRRVDEVAATAVVERESAQWPDFRGRKRDGVVPSLTLEEDWKASPPTLVWKSLIGPGWSSFTVAGNRLFTQEQRGDDEAVVCLAADTGEIEWAYTYPGRFWEAIGGAGPRATPTIGDNQLFAQGADGQLTALLPASGEVLWKRNLREDAKREPPMWGWSASPLVVDSIVVVHAGGKDDRGVLAFDASTGEPVWSVASGDHSYSSPQLASFFGVEGILMLTNTGLQFLDVKDGTTIWEHQWPVENYRAIQPLVMDHSVLIGTGLGEGTRNIRVDRLDDQWSITEEWTSKEMKPDYNDFVAYQGHLYGFDGSVLACIDLESGERKWKRGRYGNGQLVLLSESGQLLITSETGELVLVSAGPERLLETGKVTAISGKTWNHPVLIGNRVYMRNGQEVACFELTLADNVETGVAMAER